MNEAVTEPLSLIADILPFIGSAIALGKLVLGGCVLFALLHLCFEFLGRSSNFDNELLQKYYGMDGERRISAEYREYRYEERKERQRKYVERKRAERDDDDDNF